jgi:hypothetical protein
MQTPKYGQITCMALYRGGKACKNGAYFEVRVDEEVKYLCGVHSKRYADRVPLPKPSKDEVVQRKEELFEKMCTLASEAADENRAKGMRGNVCLVKMNGLFPKVDRRDGWINVYPNFKSSWQGIGLVYTTLSPMSLGPVEHGQPGLPPAFNIENFHQGSKMYGDESKADFEKLRLTMYCDPKPHRHKLNKEGKPYPNAPMYFVWIDRDGKEHHLSYVESRQFYCNFYDRLTENSGELAYLRQLLDQGYNLQICGPDAYSMDDVEKAYLNPNQPFGHERVLTVLLTEAEKPWLKYKTFEF